MQALLGFELDFWDYVTFTSLAILGAAFITALVLIAGLPGRIAIARKHPDAEAVNILGWAGFLPVVPWTRRLSGPSGRPISSTFGASLERRRGRSTNRSRT